MAKVHGYIGESPLYFRQLAKFQGVHWRKYSGLSPIGKIPGVYWRKYNGLSPAVTKQY
jgi:hypothetical protein